MSLLLLHNRTSGLVKTGLVAFYDFNKHNVLQFSEQFDNPVWGSGAVTANAAVSPRGDQTADEVFDDSTTSASIFNQIAPIQSSSLPYRFSVFVKKDDNEGRFPEFRIKAALGSSQPTTSGHLNTKTGAFALRQGTEMSVTDEGGYWRVSVGVTDTDSGNSEIRCSILPAYTDVLGETQNSSLTGSIVIWGAQLNEGSSPLPYEQTTNNQSLNDVSGRGNHGELGSSPGADTNDPLWQTGRLRFDGVDDFVDTPDSVTSGALALTLQVVFKKTPGSASAANRALLGNDSAGSFLRFQTDTTINFSVTGSVSPSSVEGPGGAIPDDGEWKMMTFRWNSGVMQDQILNGETLIASNDTDPASGAHDSTVKAIGMYNGSDFFDGEMAAILCYRRFLTGAEVLRNYRVVKALGASRGILLP